MDEVPLKRSLPPPSLASVSLSPSVSVSVSVSVSGRPDACAVPLLKLLRLALLPRLLLLAVRPTQRWHPPFASA